MKKIYALLLVAFLTVFTTVTFTSCEEKSQSETTEAIDSVLVDPSATVADITTEWINCKQESYVDSVYLHIEPAVFQAVVLELQAQNLKKITKYEIVQEFITNNYEYNLIDTGAKLQKEIDTKADSILQ